MALPDATEEAPVRRMTVARGAIHPCAMPDEQSLCLAEAAAAIAAKQAHTLLPSCAVVQPTHVDVQFSHSGDRLECTVTVQAYARQVLEPQALMALQAALVTVRPEGASLEASVVQSVA